MEHESNNSGSFAELPPPQELGEADAESSTASLPETSANSRTAASQLPIAKPDPLTTQPDPATAPAAVQLADDQSAMIADDADLIEKEWVIKAKAIVAQTKDDPHSQNKEMNKVKADYLKKRYNKDLKVSEG